MPIDPTEIDEIILAEAASPKRSEVDGQSAEGRSLDELIRARQHVAATNVRGSAWGKIKMARAVPPGAT